MKLVALIAAVLIIGGCGTPGVVEHGSSGYRWTATKSIATDTIRNVGIGSTFFSKACPKTMTPDHTQWIEQPCEKATLNTNPPGDEAYSYVFKVKIKSGFGIPYGELAAQIYVIGDRENCMRVSEDHNHRPDGRINEGNLRLSADPTERCVGPVFIR